MPGWDPTVTDWSDDTPAAVMSILSAYIAEPLGQGGWTVRGVVEVQPSELEIYCAPLEGLTSSCAIRVTLREPSGRPNLVPWALIALVRTTVNRLSDGLGEPVDGNEYARRVFDVTALYQGFLGQSAPSVVRSQDAVFRIVGSLLGQPPMRLTPTPPVPEVEDFRDLIRGFMIRDASTLRFYLRLRERDDVFGLDVDATPGELGWYVDTAVRTILTDPHRGRLLSSLRRTPEDANCAAAYDLTGGW